MGSSGWNKGVDIFDEKELCDNKCQSERALRGSSNNMLGAMVHTCAISAAVS